MTGSSGLRRVFVHAFALLGALLTAAGAAGLLRVVLEWLTLPAVGAETSEGLALALSLLIVGLPLWAASWAAAQRAVRRDPFEAGSRPRRLHLVLVRLVALAIAGFHAFDVGAWLLLAGPYDPTALARLVVWAGVWAYHERVAAEVAFGSAGTGRLDRLHVYLVSAAGLLLVAGGTATILLRSLTRLYDVLVRPEPVLIAGGDLRPAIVGAAVGAGVWWWHWHVQAPRDRDSTGWHVYLFLAGMLGGIATVLSGAGTLAHRAITWLLSVTDGSPTEHFEALPAALTCLVVGAAVWGHHRAALQASVASASGGWSGPQRAYQHLLVGVGVLATGGGLATVLALGIELALPTTALSGSAGLARRTLAVGLSLLVVGAPVWACAWRRIRRQVRRHPHERDSGARRALILGVFGLGILVSVGALGTLLYTTLDAALSGRWRVDVLAGQRWSLALVLTAGAIAAHYGLVLREDRRAVPASHATTGPAGVQRILVVGGAPGRLADELAARLAVEVEPWLRRDAAEHICGDGAEAPQAPVDAAEIAGDILATDSPEAIVLVETDGSWRVLAGGPP